jgi:acyl-CoA synthetase (AMP-forming)/AMP-acid ligase II
VNGPAFTTAAELVRQRAEDDRTGLVFESRTWTWRQVVHEAELRGALLTELRRPGPFHIGVLLENTDEYLFLLAGAALVGAVIVGINPTRRGDELAADIRVTDCQLVITDSTQRRWDRNGSSAPTARSTGPAWPRSPTHTRRDPRPRPPICTC